MLTEDETLACVDTCDICHTLMDEQSTTAVAASKEFLELIESRAGGVYASAPGEAVSEIFRRIP
jgi:hypothetical protein